MLDNLLVAADTHAPISYFRDLLRLGRARVSAAELKMVLELLREFERRSGGMRAVLQPIREQLENAEGRRSLGITLEDPFPGLF